MMYYRQFHLQSSHFNGSIEYDLYYQIIDRSHDWLLNIGIESMLTVIKNVHGHNFKIEIWASVSEWDGGSPWVVDDPLLEGLVKQWDNTNLSIHPDFLDERIRATTENMAATLHSKLEHHFPKIDFKVKVHETDQISAQYP